MMEPIPFTASPHNTLGVELELQILDPDTHDLAGRADDLLDYLAGHPYAERIKPEMTRGMIELNSSVHEHPAGLLAELRELRDLVGEAADYVGVRLAGGGVHPFMNWQDCSIYDSPRFRHLADMYGYLARQFTVFGQHIHLGVGSGDQACELIQRLSPYVPHFIALSASSPFREGTDTLFSCSRLNALHSFPLAGHLPAEIGDWNAFERHYGRMRHLGLAENLKDLYWDIRPKPDLGTIEIRVCDTPLSVERASRLAAFAQALAVAVQREPAPDPDFWLSYDSNRFHACRFGLHAHYVSDTGERLKLIDHLRQTFDLLMPIAEELGTTDLVGTLREDTVMMRNDAQWLRKALEQTNRLPQVVAQAADLWRGRSTPLSSPRRRVRASSEPIAGGRPLTPVTLRRYGGPLH